jgi:tRNA 2-thiouridine synthesizing protein D
VNSLNYTLVVLGPAYGTQSAYCAYQFAHTLLTKTSHSIKNIFFYADGIYNANHYTDPANDEFNLVVAWQQLAKKYSLTLAVCVAAAQRRGVTEGNIAEHFELTGLGELSESIAMSDRTVQF